MATEQISVRVESDTKKAAEAVFKQLGLSATDAVRMFYHQVAMQRGLPFLPRIPNEVTQQAFEELDKGGGKRLSLDAFEASLGIKDA